MLIIVTHSWCERHIALSHLSLSHHIKIFTFELLYVKSKVNINNTIIRPLQSNYTIIMYTIRTETSLHILYVHARILLTVSLCITHVVLLPAVGSFDYTKIKLKLLCRDERPLKF
jgi:hypothetical protein